MAVYRVNRRRGYTVMSNYHLRDKRLSLKSVGLLSKMLSFNDGWRFSTRGLSAICKEGPDAILSALRELEETGYLIRHRERDEKGRLGNMVFEIYEEPQAGLPDMGNPHMENPDVDNPDMDNPHKDNPAQINTNQVITDGINDQVSNNQSINLDGMDGMKERERYREIIRDNLELETLAQDKRFDIDRANEMVEIMLDAICSTRPTIRINGEDMPQEVVKSRLLKLDSRHIEYVFQAMDDCPSDIRNIRAYILTTLYNASLTMDNYYSALVNHDLYGDSRKEVLP
ncbi:MAG: helix-turn-helix domain-containing protein [Oscillospiraceae bacterium]|nr:helix-turn-helix domain-containing protein [Oscillospiraceae bacterium]